MKEIDKLPVRNRKGREFIEKVGSGGLALTSIIGLVFLLILVYQIAKPTIIDGEEGEIVAATEFLPISDYILKWDNPSVDEDGNEIVAPVVGKMFAVDVCWYGQPLSSWDAYIVWPSPMGIHTFGSSSTRIEYSTTYCQLFPDSLYCNPPEPDSYFRVV